MNDERRVIPIALAPAALIVVVVGVAVAGSVTLPNTFVPGQVADANQVNANFQAVKSAVDDNDTRLTALEGGVRHTRIDRLNTTSGNATDAWGKLDDYGTFTKLRADTKIEVMLISRMRAGVFGGGAQGIRFQVRVDDAEGSLDVPAAITVSNAVQFVYAFAVFEQLPAGSHQVSIWAQSPDGTSTNYNADPGGWGGSIVVREIQ